MKKLTLLLCFAIPLMCVAQNLRVEYSYDASGNRTKRKIIDFKAPAPPTPPEDSLRWASERVDEDTSGQGDEWTGGQGGEEVFFVEKVAQTEIKIYPNPTTEKITLEISGWQELQTGVFKLYSPNGQFLKEHLVHSATTTVSLAGMPTGIYLLTVNINNHTESWKIIKQ